MKTLCIFFFLFMISIGISKGVAPCPAPQEMANALRNTGRQLPSLLQEKIQLTIEDIYIPDSIILKENIFIDSTGNNICAYFISGEVTDTPLFIVKMKKEIGEKPIEIIKK